MFSQFLDDVSFKILTLFDLLPIEFAESAIKQRLRMGLTGIIHPVGAVPAHLIGDSVGASGERRADFTK